jgi:hypothetical protein
MQQTIALLQHSLDSMHVSALACLKAGSGISELAQNQMRSLVDYAQRNTDLDHQTPPQELTRRLFDEELHLAARDTCVLITGQLIEAQATMLDAAKSVVDCSQAWLLGRIAESYQSARPTAEAAATATEIEVEAEPEVAAPRGRRKSGA